MSNPFQNNNDKENPTKSKSATYSALLKAFVVYDGDNTEVRTIYYWLMSSLLEHGARSNTSLSISSAMFSDTTTFLWPGFRRCFFKWTVVEIRQVDFTSIRHSK